MIIKYKNYLPKIDTNSFIADNSTIIGNVSIANNSSVWFGAVIRGDSDKISIGEFSNVQDNVTIHTDNGIEVVIKDHVTIGHNAVVHGAEIGSNTLVGMNSTILNGAKIGDNCLIAAGALVTENCVIPNNSLVMGVPAKIVRTISEKDAEKLKLSALEYSNKANEYKKGTE